MISDMNFKGYPNIEALNKLACTDDRRRIECQEVGSPHIDVKCSHF